MSGLLDMFSREAGQRRRAWLDDKTERGLDWLQYYAGPGVPVRPIAELAGMLNPVNDLYHMQGATRRAVEAEPGERFPHVMDAATNAATFLMPAIGGALTTRAYNRAGGLLADDAARTANVLADTFTSTGQAGKRAVREFGADESGAVPLRGGGISDPTETGWTFRDMDRPTFSRAENKRITDQAGMTTETIPIRSINATQPRVNADFATTSSSAGELPLAVRKDGQIYMLDGHHRVVRAAEEGADQVNVRFIDLDNADRATPLLDWQPRNFTAEDDALLRQLGVSDTAPRGLLSADETPAQEVARLLREGRASEVTDDMMARVDPQEMARLYETGATGRAMPMDEASRMARARDMGFGGDVYHGTDGQLIGDAFDNWASGRVDSGYLGRATYTSESPSISAAYASRKADLPGAVDSPNIIPLRVREGRQLSVTPAEKQSVSGLSPDARMDWGHDRQNSGIDSIRVTYGQKRGGPADEIAIYDPRNIRSRFARFDPRLSHLANLSASAGGIAVLVDQYGVQGTADMLGVSAAEVQAAMQPQQPQGLLAQ